MEYAAYVILTDLQKRCGRIEELLNKVLGQQKEEMKQMATLQEDFDALEQAVSEDNTYDGSVGILLDGLTAQIAALRADLAAGTPEQRARAEALLSAMVSNRQILIDAVGRNTPVPPEQVPGT